jgi:hypothetical protein
LLGRKEHDMRTTFRLIGGIAALALMLSALPGLTPAEDAKPPQSPEELAKAFEQAGQPGPEHATLKPLVGKWTYTCKFWMDPSQPPMESQGTIERTWVLGGRFLEEKVTGTTFEGKPGFEGFGLIGYDNGRQKYTSSWVCNACTGTCNGLGAANSSGTRFTFETESYCPLRKEVVKGREELRIVNDNRTIAESYQIIDGKEVKMMELVSLRKK